MIKVLDNREVRPNKTTFSSCRHT